MPSIIFFVISLFFILGIFASFNKLIFIFLFSPLLFLRSKNNSKTILKLILLSIIIFFAGYFYSLSKIPKANSEQIFSILNQKNGFETQVISESKLYEKYQKFTGKTNNIKIIVYAPIFEQIKYGDILKISGNFEPLLDNQKNLQGVFIKGFAKKIQKTGERKTIFSRIFKFKNFIESKLILKIPAEPFEIISGLLYGKDIALPELKSAFKNAGLSHLTAMSGYNLTIISSSVFNVLKYFALPKFFINFISIFLLLIFVIFTGAQGSVMRAFIMSVILILIKNSGRIPLSRNILLGAALLISILNPVGISFDLGFQLSFLATIGIIYLAPQLEQKLSNYTAYRTPDVRKFIWKIISETMSAQIMVLPLIWFRFGELNILSFFSNFVILPFVPIFMALGFSILFFVMLPILPFVISYPFSLFANAIKLFSRLPIIYFNPPALFIIFIYIILIYLIYKFNKKNSIDFNFKC